MSAPTWRDQARPIIAQLLTEARAQNLTGRKLLRFVNERFPFGPRQYHPYRVWLDELRVQLGRRRPRDGSRGHRKDLEGQGRLFS